MTFNRKIEFFIPARSGSSRIKNKNLKKIKGKSLLEISIKKCLKTNLGDVVVSTDSKSYANFSKKIGAKIYYLREKKYSSSKSSTISSILYHLRYLKKKNISFPEYIAIIPVTNPFLKTSSIIKAYKKLCNNKKFNSIISYTKSSEHPFLYIDIINNKIKFNLLKFKNYCYSDLERTQDWPKSIIATPSLKITKTKYLIKYINNNNPNFNLKTFDLKTCTGLEISKKESFDINDNEDLKIAKII